MSDLAVTARDARPVSGDILMPNSWRSRPLDSAPDAQAAPTDDEREALVAAERVAGELDAAGHWEGRYGLLHHQAAVLLRRLARRQPSPTPIPGELPWAVENRVVRSPIWALFRDREDADAFADLFLDARVIPAPSPALPTREALAELREQVEAYESEASEPDSPTAVYNEDRMYVTAKTVLALLDGETK